MANFEIIVGSMLGASEYVADALADTLTEFGHQAQIHLQPALDQLDPHATWLVCTSTHGAGELPDNIQAFARQLQQADLSGIQFLLVGLGDSSYDTFCQGAKQMQQSMQQAGAQLLHPPMHLDVLVHPIPEEPASIWLQTWLRAQ